MFCNYQVASTIINELKAQIQEFKSCNEDLMKHIENMSSWRFLLEFELHSLEKQFRTSKSITFCISYHAIGHL